MKPTIVDSQQGYHPESARIRRSVERLLEGIPPQYLAGLEKIYLRDSVRLNRHEKMKRKRAPAGRVLLGSYFKGTPRRGAYIDLFVDEAVKPIGFPLLRSSFWMDALVAKVLYHEIGHHIHRFVRPQLKDPEAAAEEWRRKLGGIYFKRRYWYLTPILIPMLKLLKWLLTFRKARDRDRRYAPPSALRTPGKKTFTSLVAQQRVCEEAESQARTYD